MMTNVAQSTLDGVLTVCKEVGWTSHDVVAKIRHVLGGAKVGHAGTLDPAATGVLPVLIGRGTRIAEYLVEWDKEYRAVLRLGETTDTQDATGTLVDRQFTGHITPAAIREVASRFQGAIEQVPPMYSAVKVAGVPLYKSARAGKTVARQARTVTVHSLDILEIDGQNVTLRVVCSKGTYVRTLCADLGAALGVGGHLLSLERSRVGPLMLDQASTVDEVVARYAIGDLGTAVISLDQALKAFPVVVVDDLATERIRHGAPVQMSHVRDIPEDRHAVAESDQPVRVHDGEGRLLAIGKYRVSNEMVLAVEKLLVEPR
ncbi:tRNA pseudouridine synthase B [Nitrospira japonica]|uniref:tRNA pseudouridine synthase B n=1 Tax=Nitrospira japonica TaxID=1325564 RepID=A0A1W1I1R5_9BACT|nr:tRNA pseudouridine synthase B [Nitrospira japonica]